MTQAVILNKLIRYIKSTYSDDCAALLLYKFGQPFKKQRHINEFGQIDKTLIDKILKERDAYVTNITSKLKEGHCFGLSVCHGTMDVLKKLNWWEHVLVTLYNWDETQASLDSEIILPDSTNNKPTTRRQLFELAISYIVTSHALINDANQQFMLKGITQKNILSPEPVIIDNDKYHFFEMLDENGVVQTIKQRKVVAGNFTADNLESLLSEDEIQNTICLVHAYDHAIRIGYDGEKWIIYDPNYSHESSQTIHITGTKQKIINEIFSRLGTHSIALEVATFDENKEINLSAYNDLLINSPINLLEHSGLLEIVTNTPGILVKILNSVNNTSDKSKLTSTIAASLCEKTIEKYNALHLLAQSSTETLLDLINLVDNTPEGLKLKLSIAEALCDLNIHGISVFQTIATTSSPCLLKIIQLVDNTPEGLKLKSAFINALCDKNPAIWPMIIEKYYFLMPAIISLADKTSQGRELKASIATALCQTKDSCSGLYRIAHFSSAALLQIVKLVDNTPEGLGLKSAITTAICESHPQFNTLQKIVDNSPDSLLEIIKLADNTSDGATLSMVIASKLGEKSSTGKTTWEMIDTYSSEQKNKIVNCFLSQLERFDTKILIEIGSTLSGILSNDKYRNKYSHAFFSGGSGDTTILQSLFDKTQGILNSRNDFTSEVRNQY